MVHSFFLQVSQNFLIFSGVIGKKRGSQDHRDLFAGSESCEKILRIIIKISCLMRTGIKTGPTGNTFVTVYHYLTGFGRNIGSEYGAGPHTFVAARTGSVGIY